MEGRVSERFAELVAASLDERRQKPFGLERELGLPEDAVRSVVKRKAVPSIDRAEEICDALGLEFYIGPPRDRPGQLLELAGEEFATVPLYQPTPSAGSGQVVEAEAVAGQFAFRLSWLRRLGIAPAQAALFRVRGDSMAPTIPDHALILVDRAAREPRPRRVYLVRQGDALYVKRLHHDASGTVIATSDNPLHPAFTLDPAVESPVLGEVRWAAVSFDDIRTAGSGRVPG